jgi:enoyl-CoA hydratase
MPLILTETRGRAACITLNRPEALNALSTPLITELNAAIDTLEADSAIGAIIITGSERAFAAGADIKEMAQLDFADAYLADQAASIERVARTRKPVIAAVSGHCLGGGAELALMCDIIIAADTARFGQPEITLGIIPGMGATQRLPRAIGKAKAMDMILTGRTMDASEAERAGLVSRVVAAPDLLATAWEMAERIAGFPLPAVLAAKETTARAAEMPLSEGLRFEKRLFHALFATSDQKEGMAAFLERRMAAFKHR